MWEIEENEGQVESTPQTTLEVNGSVTDLEPGAVLREVVINAAREAGFGKFRFYINGEEVLPQNAPLTIEEGNSYKIAPYDVAGGNTL